MRDFSHARRWWLVLALVGGSGAFAASAIGYAQATGYYKQAARPSLYQPLNLLDNREATAWCSRTSDNLADTLSFGFKGVVKVDEIRIYTGNGFDAKTFQEFGRGRKFSLKTTSGATTFSLADRRGLQAVLLNPPLTGQKFTLEILDQYPAEDVEMPVCLTDVVFFSGGRPLNGSWLTPKLKYDRQRALLLGTWYAGYEGAPDRFLSFFFDNTYRYSYEPFDPQTKGHAYLGSYEPGPSRISLEVPGRGRTTFRVKRGMQKDDSGGVHRTLLLQSKETPPDFSQPFRDQP